MIITVKRKAVSRLPEWFEFGLILSRARASRPAVELLDFSSALATLVPQPGDVNEICQRRTAETTHLVWQDLGEV